MDIIEKFIKGKKKDESLCEDMLFISEGFIAVVDGATAKSKRLFNGKSGGRAAAEAVCGVISQFSPDIEIGEAVELLTEGVLKLYNGDFDRSAAASVIIFSKARREIWSVGDCQCIINGKFYSHAKQLDTACSRVRAMELKSALGRGMKVEELLENDIGRELILPMLKDALALANSKGKGGYGVINGSRVPKVRMKKHLLSEGDEVVLSSDGYPKLFDNLKQSEEYLQKELKENPLCINGFISTKGLQKDCDSFDDRTFIKFKV